jgi:membrane-associated phospholipid phosphatase
MITPPSCAPRRVGIQPRAGGAFGWLATAAGLALVLGTLGFAASGTLVTYVDLRTEEHLAAGRDAALTGVATAATALAQPAIGAMLAAGVSALLWLARRRGQALQVAVLATGALALAYGVKYAVAEPRPPAWLWAIAPDSKGGFPSGHATVAAMVAAMLVVLAPGRLRRAAVLTGVAIAVLVGWSRLYLGVHYPADVLGGYLAAASATTLATGLIRLPAARIRVLGRSNPSPITTGPRSSLDVK